jgi:hypothetical protein
MRIDMFTEICEEQWERPDIGAVLLERVFWRFTVYINESSLTIFAFPLFPSLFVASIRELSKHRDSENLYSSASRVVSMC